MLDADALAHNMREAAAQVPASSQLHCLCCSGPKSCSEGCVLELSSRLKRPAGRWQRCRCRAAKPQSYVIFAFPCCAVIGLTTRHGTAVLRLRVDSR